jgi:hybrid cluster-associated redox disulfide protein
MGKNEITKNSFINEVIKNYPGLAEDFFNLGMMCVGCPMSAQETIEQGCEAHGLTKKQTDKFVEMLNKKVEKENEKKNKKNPRKNHV